ncbi:hypothetical protein GCM10008955_32920 [Deinococcus malanensis]|uniref:Uncharacterized protein n=1 Tax=Deinococcus malanensis TaxID=1706855 RepID=A0ABQ2F0Q8_9DEIO|nr:DUF6624 domain-containing protein [Deinococcus malanensis]GGK36507.1 hypothetical protein GCM10008955_32920 [Deinococcus malanensis]
MRLLLTTAFLLTVTPAFAQSSQVPDPTACAKIVAPEPRPMTPALTSAVQATTTAYQAQLTQLQRHLATRLPTPAETTRLEALESEVTPYINRILSTHGWPTDPLIRTTLGALLHEPATQWCAGQAALQGAKTPVERRGAARLIDWGLIGLGAQQRYGTALTRSGRTVKAWPIEDPAGVDARRAGIGLPPLAQDVAERQASLPPRPAPPGLKRPVVLRPVCQAFTSLSTLNKPLTEGQINTLTDQAARLVEQDQASRKGQPGAKDMAIVDAESTAWLKEMLRQRGWPSTNRSDPQLASHAWLLAQHADARPAVQACILDLISQQFSTQAEAQNLAYLTDRVRLARGEPQLYGTQVSYDDVQGKASPSWLEAPERVNERRARIGLESIEQYLKRFERPRP